MSSGQQLRTKILRRGEEGLVLNRLMVTKHGATEMIPELSVTIKGLRELVYYHQRYIDIEQT